MNMDFGAKKAPVEIIKDNYFKEIYSGVNGKWYKKTWKIFDELKNIAQKYYFLNYYDVRQKIFRPRKTI